MTDKTLAAVLAKIAEAKAAMESLDGDAPKLAATALGMLVVDIAALDRLSAPEAGAGLVRYGFERDDEADGGWAFLPTATGAYVRYDDHAAALAAKEAERAQWQQAAELATEDYQRMYAERDALKAALAEVDMLVYRFVDASIVPAECEEALAGSLMRVATLSPAQGGE